MKKRKPADINAERVNDARTAEMNLDHQASPTHDEIARVAFLLYESRGRQDGQALDAWLRAEQELVRESA